MKISVIITCYNLEQFVAKAIDSALQQTFPAHEIIVVDDHSKDGSLKIIETYCRKYEKIKLINHSKNEGVLVAIINAMEAATGDVVAFLDGDDIWYPSKLADVNKCFESDEDIMMVTHLHEWINKHDAVTRKEDSTFKNMKRILQESNDNKRRDKLIKESILQYKGVWLGSAYCVRLKYVWLYEFKDWVLSLPEANLSYQDHPLATFIIFRNPDKQIEIIDKVLLKYRVFIGNSSGISNSVENALKTINRSHANIIRTYDIVSKNPAWGKELRVQKYKMLELQYLKDLYHKKRFQALVKYCRLLPYWKNTDRIKELQRLVISILCGPGFFLKLKTKHRFG